uniref:Uncharacterized protein n=1 Tax=Romanomermis culicivorax TaxID=13658 RepID=A0A915I9Z1_ROMCU
MDFVGRPDRCQLIVSANTSNNTLKGHLYLPFLMERNGMQATQCYQTKEKFSVRLLLLENKDVCLGRFCPICCLLDPSGRRKELKSNFAFFGSVWLFKGYSNHDAASTATNMKKVQLVSATLVLAVLRAQTCKKYVAPYFALPVENMVGGPSYT